MGCTGSQFYSYTEKKCVNIENYKQKVENKITMMLGQQDKGAEQLGQHVRTIGVPVLAVFGVLLGIAVVVYCVHMAKVKLANAITQEQRLTNYSNLEMNVESKAKASSIVYVDRMDRTPKEDLGFSHYPASKQEREDKSGLGGEGVTIA